MTPTHTPTRKIASAAISLILLLAAPARAQNYTISPSPFLTALDNSGHIINNACVWTYAAGGTTPATTYSDNIGTSNTNPIRADSAGRFTAYLLAGSNYKYVFESSCTPPAHGTTLRTADNILGVPAAAATVDITCTAGEAISAGQAVYLSDGSGSKTAGQCFKADSANAYSSSTAVVVGMAPAAIASGSASTIRLAGSITGLSSLVVGSSYYVGSAGAVTATAPTNARLIGAADTSTSLVLPLPSATNTDNGVDDFRLSLTTGTCVTTSDVTAATTIYLTPCRGNRIALYDTAGFATTYTTAQISIAVPATTSQMYDVFVYASSGVPTLELLAWTNDTTRATAIVQTTTGAYTKSGDLTRRYVGSVRTTTVSGQTEDSFAKRYLWNYYNRVPRPMRVVESTDSWVYSTNTYRQARATATNQLDFIVGVSDSMVEAVIYANASGGLNSQMWVAIGEDSTTTADTGCLISPGLGFNVGFPMGVLTQLRKITATGRHTWVWLEKAVTGAITWYGDNGADGTQSGIHGTVWG